MKKKIISIIIAALTSVSMFSPQTFAASRVKLIDTHKNILGGPFNMGRCYMEYELDGKRYISDKTDKETNAKAWSLMSNTEKKEIASLYVGRLKIRTEQFGAETAAAIPAFVNEQSGWKAAQDKLAAKIEKKYLAQDLIQHYSDEYVPGSNVNTYYEEALKFCSPQEEWYTNLMSYSDRADVMNVREKTYKAASCLMKGKEVYDALLLTKQQAVQTATQAASGEVISIVMDKAFIPKIIESSLKDVAIEAWNVLDKGLNITDTFKDKIFNASGAQTATFDTAQELFKILDDRAERYDRVARMLYRKADNLMYEAGQEALTVYEKIKAEETAEEKRRSDLWFETEKLKNPWYEPNSEYSDGVGSRIDAIRNMETITHEDVERQNELLRQEKEKIKQEILQKYRDYANEYQSWYDSCVTTIQTLAEADNPPVGNPVVTYGTAVTLREIEKAREDIDDTKVFTDQAILYIRRHNSTAMRTLEEETARYSEILKQREEIKMAEEAFRAQGGTIDCGTETGIYTVFYPIKFSIDYPNIELSEYYNIYDYERSKYYTISKEEDYLERISEEILNDEYYENKYKNCIDELERRYQESVEARNARVETATRLAQEYQELEANYDLAMAYYNKNFKEAKKAVASLPSYVTRQTLQKTYIFGMPIYQEWFGASYSDNPELYDVFKKYIDNREELGQRYANELRPLLKEIQTYKTRMDNAYKSTVYYREQMNLTYKDLYYGGLNYEDCGIGIVYPDTGNGSEGYFDIILSVPSDISLPPNKLSFTVDEQEDMKALEMLYDDFSGFSYYQCKIDLLTATLEENKARIYREAANGGTSKILSDIAAEYEDITRNYIWQCSWLGVGPTGIESPEYIAVRDEIAGKLGKVVFVRGISKGGVRAFDDTEYDLTVTQGDKGRLSATVFPDDATDKSIVWESADANIAVVTEEGFVIAKSVGETIIKARPSDSVRFAVDQYGNAIELTEKGEPIIADGSDSTVEGYIYRVTDEAGNYIDAEVEYAVKVEPAAEPEWSCGIDGFVITDTAGGALESIPDEGEFKVRVSVSGETNGYVILCVYDIDSVLLECHAKTAADDEAVFDIMNTDGGAFELKAFLWNSVEGMTPLAKTAAYDWTTNTQN